jgi:hypothetical protein
MGQREEDEKRRGHDHKVPITCLPLGLLRLPAPAPPPRTPAPTARTRAGKNSKQIMYGQFLDALDDALGASTQVVPLSRPA